MFPDPSEQQKAPFPLLPSAILTLTYLAAAYPHLDIADDKIVTRFGLGALQQSVDYTVFGSSLMFLGYVLCQCVEALVPLRNEYLGSLTILQLVLSGLGLLRAFMFPETRALDAAHVAFPLCFLALCFIVRHDKAARAGTCAKAAWVVAGCTLAILAVVAIGYSYTVYQTMAAGDEVPTRWMVGAVAADVVAVVRLWALADARRKGAKEAAQTAAKAKASEAKSE